MYWSDRPLDLDGRLSEPAWRAADSIAEFTQRDPDEGRPASERTVVRFIATQQGLYVGVRAYDRAPAKIVGAQFRRDGVLCPPERPWTIRA